MIHLFTTICKVGFNFCFQIFKKLHLGTVSYTPETMDEVGITASFVLIKLKGFCSKTSAVILCMIFNTDIFLKYKIT